MDKKTKKAGRVPLEIITLVFLFAAFLFFRGSAPAAKGAANPNVAGYAWSSNFGWISMNCYNNNSCSDNFGQDYGVNINTASDGNKLNLAGYAWSSDAGWISFARDANDPPDNYKFNAKCKQPTSCDAPRNCTACYNPDNGNIYGWARVVNLGDDGWINLGTSTASFPYQVSIDRTSASGTFSGFAWNGSTDPAKGLGWISFNCNNPGLSGCAVSNYFVYLKGHHLPQPTNLSAPNWSYANACPAPGAQSGVALNAILGWNLSNQSAFEVIVNTANSTSTPPPLVDKKISAPITQFVASNTYSVLLNYDTPYYWWLKVWDDFGFVSHWVQFDTAADHILTDNITRNSQKGGVVTQHFTTYLHEFPEAKFSWVPLLPLAYYPVTSTMASYYYNSASPSIRLACDKTHCSSTWTGTNALSNSATTSTTTVMTFKYGAGARINLQVEDNDNYSCVSSSPPFFVDLLPVWKEKKAQ
ncbi:MAG: hypothetical protein PHO56_05020 [Patescibacteria group bacterium]|nr:hypothetical protein [Patescibacteria group bacterium]